MDQLNSPAHFEGLAWNSPRLLERLLQRVETARFTHFLVLQAELLSLHAAECEHSDVLSYATEVTCLDGCERHQIVNHPVFRAWMAMTVREMNLRFIRRTTDRQPLEALLAEFAPMVDRIRMDVARGTRPTFYRLDLDPLIFRVLPPSYMMPTDPDALEAARQAGHPLGFFREVVGIALERIEATWPAARALVDRLVGSVGYLPDGDFRSCSASRYTGVILLSARDNSIFDLEESIVHEAGHQLLYVMNELSPVTEIEATGNYPLPWSTQVRDIYGYFHAFFIYVLLARYHERGARRGGEDGLRATTRLRRIVRGLIAAEADFEANPSLTPYGRALFDALMPEVSKLARAHHDLVT